MSGGVREPTSRVHPTRVPHPGLARLKQASRQGLGGIPEMRLKIMGDDLCCSAAWKGRFVDLIRSSKRIAPGHDLFEMPDVNFRDAIYTGVTMSTVNEELHQINDEVAISAKVLKELATDVHGLRDKIEPELLEHVRAIRSARMTVVQEIRDTLSIMSDVRKFFIESDYEIEMQRLERFVAICERLRDLKKDGTLDAVCDSALRLAVKE